MDISLLIFASRLAMFETSHWYGAIAVQWLEQGPSVLSHRAGRSELKRIIVRKCMHWKGYLKVAKYDELFIYLPLCWHEPTRRASLEVRRRTRVSPDVFQSLARLLDSTLCTRFPLIKLHPSHFLFHRWSRQDDKSW